MALQLFEEALKIFKALDNKKKIAECYHHIGKANRNRGNYEVAIELCFKALKIYKETEDKSGIANSYIGIGSINIMTGNYSKATEFYLNALEIICKFNKLNVTISI